MASLFVIIPGFGGPNIEHKCQILESNIHIIRTYKWIKKLTIKICVYDKSAFTIIPDELLNDPDINWIYKQGIVGEFLLTEACPFIDIHDTIEYILILLDDIELQSNINFSKMIEYMETFNFDIISPVLTPDSKYQFNYMLQMSNYNNIISVTSACELFCYFMKYETYVSKYYPIIEKFNPWMWGLDMMLYKYFKLNIGLINGMTMKHHYKNYAYSPINQKSIHTQIENKLPDPLIGQKLLFDKYQTNMEELSQQKAIRYIINEL